MTSLETPVSRRSRFNFANYGPDKRQIVVTLRPNGAQGDFIELRLLRRRESYQIDVADLLRLLIRQKAMHKHLAKARSRRRVSRKFARLTS